MVADEMPGRDSLLEHLTQVLQSRRKGLEGDLTLVSSAEQLLEKIDYPQVLRYRVHLRSLWQDEGEQSVTVTRRGPLAGVIRFAKTKFKRVNKRSDIQADYGVHAVVPSSKGKSIPVVVPDTFWRHIKDEK